MPKTSRAGVERLKTPPPTGRRRAEESPSASPARSRSSRAHTQRLLELECLENVLHRSCGKENRARAYLRRALNVESDGQERIFCFDGPDEHIRRALLAQRPAWVENQMAHSKIFHLKWTVSDCEQDYCHLQEGTLFNHFQKNRELTTKVGLLTNLRRFAGEEQVDVDAFFPRSYDMSSAGDVADFVLDFRRSAALNVLRQHLRLARWHRERRRLLEVVHLEAPFDGSSYVCNLNVLRLALQAVRHWLQDLDPDFLEDEGRRSWRPLGADDWDAVVLYAELSEAALCGEDEEHRKRLRGYTASGVSQKGSGRERQCSENHRLWPEFLEHHWGEASESLCKEAMEAVEALEAQWPQATLTGPMNVWVAKPGSASKGSGVICLDSLPELLHHCKVTANRIVQKYIERPLLLFSGRKFDLRQWVLVRSFQPLKVYMFSSCYLRLCNEPYDLGDLQNRQRHISNWSVNKRGRHVSDGAVASLQDFQKVLQMITGHSRYWEDQLVPQLKRSILHSLRAVQSSVVQRFESFEIFGFDFILGEDLKPWLLEVNLSPACESRTAWMSEMLERMASRVVELLLQGRLEADGLEPDWVCIADEEGLDGEERKEENPKLSVVGKALSKRFSRRLDHIWRRNEAQICLARCFRGFAARRRLCAARRRAARRWLRGLRARLWCQLVRQAGAWQCRPAAARALQGACHGFAAQRLLCAARWRAGALALQRLWRGHRARGWACQLRRQRAAIRLQRWSRSSRFLRVLRAKRRLLRWWRRVFSLRARAAVRIQAMLRQSMAVRRCRRLRQHAQGARRVELVFSVIRWRRWIALSRATAACCRLQRCWRGFRGRSQAQCRRRLREAFRSWQETGCHVRRCALRLQRAWRRLQCRRLWRRRVSLLRRLQRHWRRWRTVQGARREAAAVRLQRSVRDFLGRLAVKLARRRILAIQLAMRACIAKRRLQKLRRFEERRKRWLKQIPKEQARSTEQTDLLKRLEWQNAKAQEVQLDEDATTRSASSTRTAGEIEVYIDPVESRPQQEQEASGQSDEDVWVLPLLERLQDAAKCFDLAAGRSEGRPSTGSALRAARELRQRPGESYSKPTMSSARRNAEKGGNEVADLNALLLRKATPKSKPRRGSLKPWRLTE